MKKFSYEYKDLLYENLEDKVKDKVSQDFSSLKSGTLSLIENSVNDYSELVNVQNFISDFINNPDSGNLVGFTEDRDIFDFYLKYQNDIDQICNENGFLDEAPKNKNIFSLYEFVIEGSKFAVIESMKILKNEIF
jgi:hypothetical protein